MKKLIIFIASLLFSYDIFVATSSNLTYVMPEIIKAFNKKYPNEKIKFILSSSGKLTAQILRGAPFDIFLSADMKYPKFLYSNKIGLFPPKVYTRGKIVFFSFKRLDFSNLKNYTIAISKPKTTPYGRAALEVLKNMGVYNKNNLVYAETIAGVLSYVRNGADLGIISKSLIYSNKLKRKFYFKDINESFYTPINQGVLLINKKAKDFYNFLLSKEAKKIFKRYGYE